MSVNVHLNTNIKDVVTDAVDSIHRIDYDSNLVCFRRQDSGYLDLSDGNLVFSYTSDSPIIHELVGNSPSKEKTLTLSFIQCYTFPLLFELERIARDPVSIRGIESINTISSKEDPAFMEEERKLRLFLAKYARAQEYSHLSRPILEKYYRCMREIYMQNLPLNAFEKTFGRWNEPLRDAYERRE